MKFGFEMTGTVEDSVSLNKKNGKSLWQNSTKKGINNSRISLKMVEIHRKLPVGYTEITCRLFFDLDLDKTRKS